MSKQTPHQGEYKILHTISSGTELYEVFYNDLRMAWYDYEITKSTNPYRTLKEATDMIESHKKAMRMIEESRKDDLREWLTEEGKPFLPQNQEYSVENDHTHSSKIGEGCVLLLMVLVALGVYLWVY